MASADVVHRLVEKSRSHAIGRKQRQIERIGPAVAVHVVAGFTLKQANDVVAIAAVHGVDAGAGGDGIVAAVPRNDVRSQTAQDRISPLGPDQRIIAIVAADHIAGRRPRRVDFGVGIDRVVPRSTVQNVRIEAALDPVIAGAAKDLVRPEFPRSTSKRPAPKMVSLPVPPSTSPRLPTLLEFELAVDMNHVVSGSAKNGIGP